AGLQITKRIALTFALQSAAASTRGSGSFLGVGGFASSGASASCVRGGENGSEYDQSRSQPSTTLTRARAPAAVLQFHFGRRRLAHHAGLALLAPHAHASLLLGLALLLHLLGQFHRL